MLKINNISCTVKKRNLLDGINLEVPDSEILGVTVGPCCGKSLLLNVLSGNYRKYTGEILLDGRDILNASGKYLKRLITGCAFENPEYNPESTVYDTVLSGRRSHKSIFTPYTDIDREAAGRCIDQLRLGPFSGERMKNISASIVRMSLFASSIIAESGLLLVDSPESGTGYRQKADITALLKKYTASAKKTVIVASSDLNFLAAACDRIIILEKGKIAAEGSASIIDDKFMKRFFNIESMISRNVVTSLPEIHVIES